MIRFNEDEMDGMRREKEFVRGFGGSTTGFISTNPILPSYDIMSGDKFRKAFNIVMMMIENGYMDSVDLKEFNKIVEEVHSKL